MADGWIEYDRSRFVSYRYKWLVVWRGKSRTTETRFKAVVDLLLMKHWWVRLRWWWHEGSKVDTWKISSVISDGYIVGTQHHDLIVPLSTLARDGCHGGWGYVQVGRNMAVVRHFPITPTEVPGNCHFSFGLCLASSEDIRSLTCLVFLLQE